MTAALLIIDVQKAIDAAYHAAEGARNNPSTEAVIAQLLATWRQRGDPIVHIRHDSTFSASSFRPGQSGNDFKPEVAPMSGETIIPKRTNSAFIGTDLEAWLRERGIDTLAVCGVSTNNSVEATVRMAGNLGFRVLLVDDACFCFGKRDWSGRLRTAEEVHAMSLANMSGEYAEIVRSSDLLR
jgi:nicotinamidase-related amidase